MSRKTILVGKFHRFSHGKMLQALASLSNRQNPILNPLFERQMNGPHVPLSVIAIAEDADILASLAGAFEQDGLESFSKVDAEACFEAFSRLHPNIVFIDLAVDARQGIEMMQRMVQADPAGNVLLVAAHYSADTAVEAIQKRARDYLTKPLDIEKIRNRVAELRMERSIRRKTWALEQKLVGAYQFEGIISRSPLMLDVFAKIRRIAPHFRNVLVTGATGTGKELVARALHRLSPALPDRFVVCNSSTLVDTLADSELFGFARGAFTGATQDRAGLFESAEGGVLFLDEIGELSVGTQARLLGVLQDHRVRRVGASTSREVDVRVVAATNRDLRAMVRAGAFREDLYYRLTSVEIALPRLEHRREDLPLLERYFLDRFATEYKKPVAGLTRRAQSRLAGYHWPGNIRELQNVIGNACMMTDSTFIDLDDLPEWLRATSVTGAAPDDMLFSLEEAQRRHLAQVLQRVGGNKLRAAKVLGIGRTRIYKMLTQMKTAQRDCGA